MEELPSLLVEFFLYSVIHWKFWGFFVIFVLFLAKIVYVQKKIVFSIRTLYNFNNMQSSFCFVKK